MIIDRHGHRRGIDSLVEAADLPPPWLHPLAGAGLRHFRNLLARHRGIGARSVAQRCLTFFALLERWPLAFVEAAWIKERVERHEPEHPPIFIIGHWGSGTTRLHQLLSLRPDFAFPDFGDCLMPWNLFGTSTYCRAYIRPFLPRDRLFDAIPLSLEDPQEEEMALASMGPISFFLALYFPARLMEHARMALFPESAPDCDRFAFEEAYRLFHRRLSLKYEGRRIVFKNPAATTRMPLLMRLFPGAKFVHLVRDPAEVYAASINRLKFLLHGFAMQDFRGIDLHEVTLELYEALMRRYLRDRESMPPQSLVEVRFEDLEREPKRVLSAIQQGLGLGGVDGVAAEVEERLRSESPYHRTPRPIDPEALADVRERWAFSFDFWGYAR